MRLLSVVYERTGLFNADAESPMAEDIVLYTSEFSSLQLDMPNIHGLRQQKPRVSWKEIYKSLGHSPSWARGCYRRWCKAMGYTPS